MNTRQRHCTPKVDAGFNICDYAFDAASLKGQLQMPNDRLCTKCGKIGHRKSKCQVKNSKTTEESARRKPSATAKENLNEIRSRSNSARDCKDGFEEDDIQFCKDCGELGHASCQQSMNGVNTNECSTKKRNARISRNEIEVAQACEVGEVLDHAPPQNAKKSDLNNEATPSEIPLLKTLQSFSLADNPFFGKAARNDGIVDESARLNFPADVRAFGNKATQKQRGIQQFIPGQSATDSSSSSSEDSDDECSLKSAHGGAIKLASGKQALKKLSEGDRKAKKKKYRTRRRHVKEETVSRYFFVLSLFTKLHSTFLNCELSMTLLGCRGSCIGICFWFILLHAQAVDKNKNWMKRRGKKRLFSSLTSGVQRDMQMSHKGFLGHGETGKPTITDDNL